MFSSDTPYESLDEAATWFDNVPLSYAAVSYTHLDVYKRQTLESQIDELFGRFADTDEIIVATDIFGGSVNNEFLARMRKQNFWLVSGMNLPMIVQLTMIKETDDIQSKIEEAVEGGKEMTCFCNPMVEDMSKEKEEF